MKNRFQKFAFSNISTCTATARRGQVPLLRGVPGADGAVRAQPLRRGFWVGGQPTRPGRGVCVCQCHIGDTDHE
jgi:hypothetical protein